MAGNETSRDPLADDPTVADSVSSQLTAEQELELVRAQLAEARDRMLRAQAELDNYRKRAQREMSDERKYAEMSLLRDLLPVLDNINRAVDAAGKKADAGSLLEGCKLVRQQLDTLLERHHCQKIEPTGQPFDPAHHEAVMQQPNADVPDHTVLQVLQTGYQLHDRVVRPAQVMVSKQP